MGLNRFWATQSVFLSWLLIRLFQSKNMVRLPSFLHHMFCSFVVDFSFACLPAAIDYWLGTLYHLCRSFVGACLFVNVACLPASLHPTRSCSFNPNDSRWLPSSTGLDSWNVDTRPRFYVCTVLLFNYSQVPFFLPIWHLLPRVQRFFSLL